MPTPAACAINPDALVRRLAEQALSRAAGAPLVGGNSVELLIDARDNYAAWLAAMRAARRRILLENYIIADDDVGREFRAVLVERAESGEFDVRLLDDWTPTIYISRRCIELYRDKGGDPKTREYLKRKIQAAQWLMESIEQRRHTLERVTRAIIQHQREFLDRGPEHIEPLKMQQIADQVGVHVTTVSRAVDDKWVQTPRGIFPLKRFFGGGTQTATGEEVAWETIKQKLLEIIDKEDKSNPWSDEDLVNKLHEAGYPVARRTVTKYRKMLNIPSSRQRKDWTAGT